MFSYYGSKSKIVHLYPAPKHNLIIEPFAGSARYALRYFERDVILIDKFPKIIAVWKYLQQASEKDILGLPDMDNGEDLRDMQSLSNAEIWLIGFTLNGGTSDTRYKTTGTGNFNVWKQNRRDIAKQLFKIRHWKLITGEYACVEGLATWFIDPPYFKGGNEYKCSAKSLNFAMLRQWIESRNGQTIVCENSSANWMPFNRLTKMQGTNFTTTEVFWTNEKVEIQASLF